MALDKLDSMAKDSKYANVQFVSICCDQLDGARNIIEKDDDLRWQNVSHFFMESRDKEEAKRMLGFKSVPFYVVLNESGEITQLGNEKAVDFDIVPGVVRDEDPISIADPNDHSTLASRPTSIPPVVVDRIFDMDDLDF